MDGEAFGREVVDIVRGYVERELAPIKSENEELKARIAELETRQPEKGEKGEKGDPGESLTGIPVEFFDIMRAEVHKQVADAVAEIPPAEKGEKGDPGEAGEKGEAGEPGRDGKDGRGVKELLIDRDGILIATMDDGEMKSLGPVIGKDGRDGIDGQKGDPGKDGFNLEDFTIDCGSDSRSYVLKFERGDMRHEYELTFPVPVYCGVFKQGQAYEPGDLVTWGGSLWHCEEKTMEKPEAGPWKLAVKKGRDGKDAKPTA